MNECVRAEELVEAVPACARELSEYSVEAEAGAVCATPKIQLSRRVFLAPLAVAAAVERSVVVTVTSSPGVNGRVGEKALP